MTRPEGAREVAVAVPAEMGGQRLDRFLAGLPDLGLTRSHVQRLIAAGLVRVGGQPARAARRVRAGERVEVVVPPPAAVSLAPEAIPVEVIYEDEDLLVVNKPRGLVVHPAPGHPAGTLVNALLARCPGLEALAAGSFRPGIVHRLDKDTTGLLVVAKTPEAHLDLARQLKERTVAREYLALVRGQPQAEGTVDAPVGRHPVHRQRMAVVAGGRPARTRFRVLERFPAPRRAAPRGYALLAVRLETGRTHQVRVHLSHLGHPVAGDPVYGGVRGELGLAGQALHAARLTLVHPRRRETMTFTAPPPADFAAALARLRRLRGGEGMREEGERA